MAAHRKLVAVDFDGVIHAYTSPWTNAATIADGPVPGAIEFLKALVDDGRFEVCIVSSRCKTAQGRRTVKVWLDQRLIEAFGDAKAYEIFGRLNVVDYRPPAFVTIDDRGLTFTGEWPSLDTLAAFKPWNKRPAPRSIRTDPDELTKDQLEGHAEVDELIATTSRARDRQLTEMQVARLLAFAADRLVHVYGDDKNVDFIQAMRREVNRLAPMKLAGRDFGFDIVVPEEARDEKIVEAMSAALQDTVEAARTNGTEATETTVEERLDWHRQWVNGIRRELGIPETPLWKPSEPFVDPFYGPDNDEIRTTIKKEVPGAAGRQRAQLNVLLLESGAKLKLLEPILDLLGRWGFTYSRSEIGDAWLCWQVYAPDGTPAFRISEDAVPIGNPELAVEIVVALKMAWEDGRRAA